MPGIVKEGPRAMNFIIYGITLLLALWPRRAWPAAVFVALFFAMNFSAYFIAADGDPRKNWVWLLTPSVVQLVIALIGRGIAELRNGGSIALLWAGYEVGGLATLIALLFFDGVQWTWWNWIFIIPLSLFQSQIWPAIWLLAMLGFR